MLPGLSGKPVVVIGGGPSHTLVAPSVLAGRRFIATNSSGVHFLPIATSDDILYFTDNSWSERWQHRIAEWPGKVVTANRNAAARLGLEHIDVTALTEAMQAPPDYVQASSGHIAACLAALSGASRICLIGFDCVPYGQTHGHGDYSDVGTNHQVFADRCLPGWSGLAAAFRRMSVDVVNCSPDSAIAAFRLGSLAEEMA